jgi:uncharacterized protein (TIGR00725 family)
MGRKLQISVIGFDAKLCTDKAYEAAYQVGSELAKKSAVLIDGGLLGVMEGACKGATEAGGLCIGIIPSDDRAQANRFCTVVIPSGLGFARNFLVVNSADAIIIVGGGAGTLTEAAAAYGKGTPLIAVKGTGGVADEWAGKYFDGRRTLRVQGAKNPKEAVRLALLAASRKPDDLPSKILAKSEADL